MHLSLLGYILWDQDPILFSTDIFGNHFEARWYGLLFALSFIVGQYIMARIFAAEGKTEKQLESLTLYMIAATVVGARLGHCLFYEPDYYLSHPIEILKVWKGGLASHGASIGMIGTLYFWARKEKVTWLWILDRVVIVVALGGAFIRLGNLMNSEIIGKPTDMPSAFLFVNAGKQAATASAPGAIKSITITNADSTYTNASGQARAAVTFTFSAPGADPLLLRNYGSRQFPSSLFQFEEAHEHLRPEEYLSAPKLSPGLMEVSVAAVPRHPTQIYESVSCLLLFAGLFATWQRRKATLPAGRLFGVFMVVLFSLRFVYEFLKENQVEFEEELTFNMGQALSIPLLLFGLAILARSYRKSQSSKTGQAIS